MAETKKMRQRRITKLGLMYSELHKLQANFSFGKKTLEAALSEMIAMEEVPFAVEDPVQWVEKKLPVLKKNLQLLTQTSSKTPKPDWYKKCLSPMGMITRFAEPAAGCAPFVNHAVMVDESPPKRLSQTTETGCCWVKPGEDPYLYGFNGTTRQVFRCWVDPNSGMAAEREYTADIRVPEDSTYCEAHWPDGHFKSIFTLPVKLWLCTTPQSESLQLPGQTEPSSQLPGQTESIVSLLQSGPADSSAQLSGQAESMSEVPGQTSSSQLPGQTSSSQLQGQLLGPTPTTRKRKWTKTSDEQAGESLRTPDGLEIAVCTKTYRDPFWHLLVGGSSKLQLKHVEIPGKDKECTLSIVLCVAGMVARGEVPVDRQRLIQVCDDIVMREFGHKVLRKTKKGEKEHPQEKQPGQKKAEPDIFKELMGGPPASRSFGF